MIARIAVVAIGGLGLAAALDWVAGDGDDEDDGPQEPEPGQQPDDDGGGDGGDLEELENRMDELRKTIGGHLERLDGRVPEGLGERIDEALERVEDARAANTDLLERLRRIEERLETADAGPDGGEPPDDSEPTAGAD